MSAKIATVADIVEHRTAEELRFLQHDAEGAPEVGLLDACDAESVVGDRPVLDLVEPVDQVRDRGLARAGSADEGDLLAGIGRQGDVVKHLFFRHIAEVHIGQGHEAFQLPERSVRLLPGPSAFTLLLQGDGAFVHFRSLVQERIQAVRTGGSHHDGIDFVGDLRDGPGEVALERQERHQRTQGERCAGQVAQGDERTQDREEHVHEVADVGVDRHDDIADLVGVVHARAEFLVQGGELLQRLVLVTIDFDDLLAGDHLLDESVHPAQVALPFHEVLAGDLAQTGRHLVHQEGHQDGHDRERDAQDHHTHEGSHDRDERTEEAGDGVPHHLPERVHVVGVHGHDVSVRMVVEILEGQRLHMGEQVLADAGHGPLPHVDHDQRLHRFRSSWMPLNIFWMV